MESPQDAGVNVCHLWVSAAFGVAQRVIDVASISCVHSVT